MATLQLPMFGRRLDRLGPVQLDALEADAELLTRHDRKYLVDLADLVPLLDGLPSATRVLDIGGRRTFGYRSIYFDTPELISFLGAARGRPGRFKVRTRTYLDSGSCNLELKRPDHRGRTSKVRTPHLAGDPSTLSSDELEFLGAFPEPSPHRDSLLPVVTTSYQRTTLLLPEGARVTFDTGYSCEIPDGDGFTTPGLVFVETKSHGRPTAMDRLMWSAGLRPRRVSKFGAGLACLRADLPANRWHRAVQRLRAASVGDVP